MHRHWQPVETVSAPATRACWRPVETVSAPPTEAAGGNNFRPVEAASTPAIVIAGGLFWSWSQGLPAACKRSFYARPQRLWGSCGSRFCSSCRSCWQPVEAGSASLNRPPLGSNFCTTPQSLLAACGNSFCNTHRGTGSLWRQFLHQPPKLFGSLRKQFLPHPQRLPVACGNNLSASFKGCFRPVEAASTPAKNTAGNLFRSRPQGLPATCRSSFYAWPQRFWGSCGSRFCTSCRSCWQPLKAGSASLYRPSLGSNFCTAHRACWQPVETVSAPLTDALTACRNNFPASFKGCFRPVEAASTPAIEFAGGFFRGWPQGLPATSRSSIYARPQRLWGSCGSRFCSSCRSCWQPVEAGSASLYSPFLGSNFCTTHGACWQPVETVSAPLTEALTACASAPGAAFVPAAEAVGNLGKLLHQPLWAACLKQALRACSFSSQSPTPGPSNLEVEYRRRSQTIACQPPGLKP